MIDRVDRTILSILMENARASYIDLSRLLAEQGIKITDRSVAQRMKSLEKEGVIKGYIPIVDPTKIGKGVLKTSFIKLQPSRNLAERVKDLERYLSEAPFCITVIHSWGEWNWICAGVFPSEKDADRESNIFLSTFGDIVADYRVEKTRWSGKRRFFFPERLLITSDSLGTFFARMKCSNKHCPTRFVWRLRLYVFHITASVVALNDFGQQSTVISASPINEHR